jgi:hypothetical protein
MDDIKEKIKNKIMDLISMEASGRLVVFKPENSDKDLVVERKGDYKKAPIFLNVYRKSQTEEKKRIGSDKNLYFIFTDFDIVKQNIEDEIFVVYSVDSKKVAIKKNELARFLIEKLDRK